MICPICVYIYVCGHSLILTRVSSVWDEYEYECGYAVCGYTIMKSSVCVTIYITMGSLLIGNDQRSLLVVVVSFLGTSECVNVLQFNGWLINFDFILRLCMSLVPMLESRPS